MLVSVVKHIQEIPDRSIQGFRKIRPTVKMQGRWIPAEGVYGPFDKVTKFSAKLDLFRKLRRKPANSVLQRIHLLRTLASLALSKKTRSAL